MTQSSRLLRGAIALAFVATLAGGRAHATALVSAAPTLPSKSFWDARNWFPQEVPGAGDSARLIYDGTLYLGDTAAAPGQTATIQRLELLATPALFNLFWGPDPAVGGSSGGLRFSQDDPADLGVGLRIAGDRFHRGSFRALRMWDAQNDFADRFNIAIGNQDPFSQPESANVGNTLALYSTDYSAGAPTRQLQAGYVSLQSSYSRVEVNPFTALFAEDVGIYNLTTGSQVHVQGGELYARRLSFNGLLGSGNQPLLVDSGGFVVANQLYMFNGGPGNQETIRVTDGSVQLFNASLSVTSEATVAIEVDGAQASMQIDSLYADPLGATTALRVRNGARLTTNGATFVNVGASPSGVPARIEITVDGAGSRLSGPIETSGGGASLLFTNQGACEYCTLHLDGSGGSLRFDSQSRMTDSSIEVSNDADAEFAGSATIDGAPIRATHGARVSILDVAAAHMDSLRLEGAVATIRAPNRPTPIPAVVAGTVNVGSSYLLPPPPPPQINGDLAGAGVSRLDLQNRSELRIGDDPLRPELPLLAIGSGGTVTLDATSSAFIGDANTPAAFQPGAIVLDDGGYLCGTGRINGTEFAAGTHPIVLNTGGRLCPGFSPGTLTIDGAYVQQDGVFEIEIGGPGPGEYDVLDAADGATFLGGTIYFKRLDGFTGRIGDRLDLFAGRSVSIDPQVAIIDESGLGLVFDPATGIATVTQEQSPVFDCANGIDDDGDGSVDLLDPGCDHGFDGSERTARPGCDNGLDDDGDGLADQDDPGCPLPIAPYENPRCDNGLDDDGDGFIDGDDATCRENWPYWEAEPNCGLGAEVVLVLAALRWRGRRGRRRLTNLP